MPETDESVVDKIAVGLGTQSSWNGGDCLEWIANLIGQVRPHPGSEYGPPYAEVFQAATGRAAPAEYVSEE